MIEVSKRPEPTWLTENQAGLTQEFRDAPTDRKPTPWRHSSVVSELIREASGKCIYCEGFIGDVSYETVDHLKPKERFPEHVLDWDNLGLCCTRCNTNKGSYWTDNPDLRLLNPFVDVVGEHVEHHGPMLAAAIGSRRGENTVRKLKLQRAEVIVAKSRKIQELDDRLRRWNEEQDLEMKDLLADDIRYMIAPDQEYSSCLNAYAADKRFPVRADAGEHLA